MSVEKTPAEILEESKFVFIEDYEIENFIVSFYDDEDEIIIDIVITPVQTAMIIKYITDNFLDVSVYQTTLSNLMLPSNKQLYELIGY
tara:strand:+ start:36 stop:299 length:264 start_codon:yes stop_codon:yes gene_type:complete